MNICQLFFEIQIGNANRASNEDQMVIVNQYADETQRLNANIEEYENS
jgi:hypothetical protein